MGGRGACRDSLKIGSPRVEHVVDAGRWPPAVRQQTEEVGETGGYRGKSPKEEIDRRGEKETPGFPWQPCRHRWMSIMWSAMAVLELSNCFGDVVAMRRPASFLVCCCTRRAQETLKSAGAGLREHLVWRTEKRISRWPSCRTRPWEDLSRVNNIEQVLDWCEVMYYTRRSLTWSMRPGTHRIKKRNQRVLTISMETDLIILPLHFILDNMQHPSRSWFSVSVVEKTHLFVCSLKRKNDTCRSAVWELCVTCLQSMITSPWFNHAAAPVMQVGNSLDYDVSTLSTASVC